MIKVRLRDCWYLLHVKLKMVLFLDDTGATASVADIRFYNRYLSMLSKLCIILIDSNEAHLVHFLIVLGSIQAEVIFRGVTYCLELIIVNNE